jgi:hypothetical protein
LNCSVSQRRIALTLKEWKAEYGPEIVEFWLKAFALTSIQPRSENFRPIFRKR